MAAWLLWLRRHKGYLWRRYLALLPREEDMACLLNFQGPDEMDELQFADLKREAEIQANWWALLRPSAVQRQGRGRVGAKQHHAQRMHAPRCPRPTPADASGPKPICAASANNHVSRPTLQGVAPAPAAVRVSRRRRVRHGSRWQQQRQRAAQGGGTAGVLGPQP
jgi:hypothetical protein